jgi:hypothetical protein
MEETFDRSEIQELLVGAKEEISIRDGLEDAPRGGQ